MTIPQTWRLPVLLGGILTATSMQSMVGSVAQSRENQAPPASRQSPEDEFTLGESYAAQLENSSLLLRDPDPNVYVSAIGKRLARSCNLPFPITVKITASNDIDAIVLPGGFLYLTSELISAAGDEAELAGVMAHELAHMCVNHFGRGMTQAPLILPFDFLHAGGSFQGPPPLTQSFPPKLEAEADDFAFQYLEKAGYDPQALSLFFTRIEALEKERPGLIATTFRSHLQAPGRNRKARAHAKSLRRGEYIENTSEFDAVKARLLQGIAGEPRLFSVLLTTPQAAVKAGSRVELEMALTNISNRSVSFYSDGLFPYQIDVRGSSGTVAPDTEAGLSFKEKWRSGVAANGSGFYYFLKPGEKIVSKCVLNDYYDTSKPGTYFIQVEHRRTLDSRAIIKSNMLKVTTLALTNP